MAVKTVKTTRMKKSASARYLEAVGRRKTAVARVRITPAAKATFLINGQSADKYFPLDELRQTAAAPLGVLEPKPILQIGVKVSGGGISAQAGAVAHGLSRALVKQEPSRRSLLKSHLFLRRDARMKERRKFGLKKARKAPQWSKR